MEVNYMKLGDKKMGNNQLLFFLSKQQRKPSRSPLYLRLYIIYYWIYLNSFDYKLILLSEMHNHWRRCSSLKTNNKKMVTLKIVLQDTVISEEGHNQIALLAAVSVHVYVATLLPEGEIFVKCYIWIKEIFFRFGKNNLVYLHIFFAIYLLLIMNSSWYPTGTWQNT